MKKRTVAIMTALILSMSLAACSKDDSFPRETGNNSEAERIAELEQELEELKAQQSQDNNEDSDTEQEEIQQLANETENLLKTTIESPETSGVCGANLTWYYQNGVLAITGTGEMTDYDSYKDTPWYDLREKIGWVIIDDGATTVGNNAFADYNELSKIVLPDTLTSIGDYAFAACNSVKEISFKGDIPNSLGVKWFSNFKSWDVTVPVGYEQLTEEDKLRSIGKSFIPMTIYYTGNTFDELINSYPYWSDYGVNWVKQ